MTVTQSASSQPRTRVLVLISGNGSNLQALIDAQRSGTLPVELVAVISNRPGVKGLQRAESAGIPTEVVDHTLFDNRDNFDQALQQTIDAYAPDLVVLAGFMRILTERFTHHYHGRMLNIHPSLLPKYQGLNTHERVLQAGDAEHGVSVHFVTAELDGGPVALQARVPVLPDDDANRLAQRVLQQEHRIYPLAVKWFAEGRLRMVDGRVFMDSEPLGPSGYPIDNHASI